MEPTPKQDIKEFEETVAKLQKTVISNTKIVTREDMGQDYMLHIAVKRYKQLTPIFSRKAAASENNTLVRVHVAPHIRGCILGYANLSDDLMWRDINKKDSAWSGGYYVHKVDFKIGLKPNPKMVFDAKATDEVWMITYNQDTVTYPTTVVGKLIPISTRIIRNTKAQIISIVDCIMEVTEPFKIDNDQELEKGYYQFSINERKATLLDLMIIDKAKYEELKKNVGVTLLNFQEPSFKEW